MDILKTDVKMPNGKEDAMIIYAVFITFAIATLGVRMANYPGTNAFSSDTLKLVYVAAMVTVVLGYMMMRTYEVWQWILALVCMGTLAFLIGSG